MQLPNCVICYCCYHFINICYLYKIFYCNSVLKFVFPSKTLLVLIVHKSKSYLPYYTQISQNHTFPIDLTLFMSVLFRSVITTSHLRPYRINSKNYNFNLKICMLLNLIVNLLEKIVTTFYV